MAPFSSLARLAGRGFEFLDPGELRDEELALVLRETIPATGQRAPVYRFQMKRPPSPGVAGTIDLRIGATTDIITYAGQIGYRVQLPYRGHHFAGRATRLLLPLAKRHGLEELWITCDPDNAASRRTCEYLGAELISTVAVPKSHPYYKAGSLAKCRYRLRL